MQQKTTVGKSLVGFTVDYFKGLPPSAIIEAMKILGVEFIEINNSIFNDLEKSLSSLEGLTTAFHLPYQRDLRMDQRNNGEVEKMLNLLEKHAGKLNIRHFICHPPEWTEEPNRFDSAAAILFENLKRVPAPVYFENVIAIHPDQYLHFMSMAQSALGSQCGGMCWDACHYLVSGYDAVHRLDEHAGSIGAIHLSDCYADKDTHLPFHEQGSVPVNDILRQLKQMKFTGTITLEMIPHSRKDLKAYLNSYLTVLRRLNFAKFLATRIRLFFLTPLINRLVTERPDTITILGTQTAQNLTEE